MEKFFTDPEHSNLDFEVLKHLQSKYRHKIPANNKLIASNVYALGKPLKGAIYVDDLLDDSEMLSLISTLVVVHACFCLYSIIL